MSSLRSSVVIGPVLAIALVACSKDNPEYCDGHPDDTTNCPAGDADTHCTTDAECPGAVCDTTSGACVECTTANTAACTGDAPVCSNEHTCTGCTSHDQCAASNVCLPSGACAEADDVAYVSAAGTGTTCTHAAPCPLLASALATNKAVIKIAADGAQKDTATVTIVNSVTILAEPGATFDRDGEVPILYRAARRDARANSGGRERQDAV